MKFKQVSRIEEDIKLPNRSTKESAGYDFYAPEDVVIKPYERGNKPVNVYTGIKVYLDDFYMLMLANRSSNPLKRNLLLANGVGIIDADYVDNPSNEGEIIFNFYNMSDEDIVIEKGEKIGQGIILPFGITDNDKATGKRTGGHGSTGK